MSLFVATIKKINSIDGLNIVEFSFCNQTLKMMSLDLSKDIQIDKKVKLSVNPSNVIIAKNLFGEISLSNQLVATINSIESGELLCSVILKIENIYIESIITKDSAERMKLKKDEQVTILIKASNLSIEEIIHD